MIMIALSAAGFDGSALAVSFDYHTPAAVVSAFSRVSLGT
jgi:hypothetical protein